MVSLNTKTCLIVKKNIWKLQSNKYLKPLNLFYGNFRLFLDGYELSTTKSHQIPIECLQATTEPKTTQMNKIQLKFHEKKKIPTECYTQTLNFQEKYLEASK